MRREMEKEHCQRTLQALTLSLFMAARDAKGPPENRVGEGRGRGAFLYCHHESKQPVTLSHRQGSCPHWLPMFLKTLRSLSVKILNSSNRSLGM